MKRRALIPVISVLAAAVAPAPGPAADRFDPTLMIVLGDGISAGFSGFRLTEAAQRQAWPALVANQMGAYIAVPALRESGQVGVVNSYQPLRGLLPQVAQSGERALPFPFFSMNLSVPFLRAGDSLRLRPQPQRDGIKLINAIEGDLRATLVNAILGGPYLVLQPPILLTQAEYAVIMNPTLVFIQLGFSDASDAAIANDASRLTSAASFANDYTEILTRLAATDATLVAMTVPDPTETGYFASIDELASRYGLANEDLRTRFGLAAGDMLTLGGMVEIADALRGRRGALLSQGSVLSAGVAASVRSAVNGYNNAIRSAVQGKDVAVFDLHEFVRQVKVRGTQSGGVPVTGAYLGGFYSEDGLYPSPAGQALLANAILQFINTNYSTGFSPVPAVIP